MEIIKRYGQIMACNMKYLLDKSDNEEKIIRVYLREINEELKKADKAYKSITEEESILVGELDSYKNQLDNIESSLKETKDKDDLDDLLMKKETIIRSKNKIARKQDLNKDNIKKISTIKEKLNADIIVLNDHMEMLKSSADDSKVNDEKVIINGPEETKSIIYNILSKLEKHEK